MKPVAAMTSAEIAAARRLPIHVQTIARPSLVTPGTWVYSDIEETSPEALALAVSRALAGPHGWRVSGPAFVRTPPTIDTPE